MLFFLKSYSQAIQSNIFQQKLDSTATLLSNLMGAQKSIVKTVLGNIETSNNKMHAVVFNKSLSKDAKNAQLKQIANERDIAVDKLLTPPQVAMLRKYFADKSRIKIPAPHH